MTIWTINKEAHSDYKYNDNGSVDFIQADSECCWDIQRCIEFTRGI